MKIVLPLGLDVNARNEKGRTALHIAAQSSDECAVRMLLKAGASPDIQDREGNTPLHLIFESEEYRPDVEFPAFHALVTGGANRSISNAAGKTPADVAVEVKYPEEYLQLLDPIVARPASNFVGMWEEPFRDFLPTAMVGVALDGVLWPSVQHYFYAQKTTDLTVREHLRAAATPHDALIRL
ncbi:MAG TPA: ankyrin repeat domain-containing protein, partial [Verrucomicrobiae bacterium]